MHSSLNWLQVKEFRNWSRGFGGLAFITQKWRSFTGA